MWAEYVPHYTQEISSLPSIWHAVTSNKSGQKFYFLPPSYYISCRKPEVYLGVLRNNYNASSRTNFHQFMDTII